MTPQNAPSLETQFALLKGLDVGLVILDENFTVTFWNRFMSNHSGIMPKQILGSSLFSHFPDLDTQWFRRKLNTTISLHNPSFITWEERPRLFQFKSYRPITGSSSMMYQNITLLPLNEDSGSGKQVAIILYDVTDEAVSHQALTAANNELSQLSRTDRLTKLNNRGYWEHCLEQEFERFVRTQHPTSLIMLDIDHFKQVNDTYGHLAGDAVLVYLAQVIQQMIRSTDIAGRFGGEEFGIILPNTPAANAEILAERLRYKIETNPIVYANEQLLVTISLGIAAADSVYLNYQHWLEKADQALYQAKQKGRNQFVTF